MPNSIQFQVKDTVVEMVDERRLGLPTKRFQDFILKLVQEIGDLQALTARFTGGVAALTAESGPVTDTETAVLSTTIARNLLAAGTTYRINASGFVTATTLDAITFNLRIGPTTLTGAIPASLAANPGNSGTVTSASFILTLMLVIRAAGAAGKAYATGTVISLSSGASPSQALELANEIFVSAEVSIDTTVANVLELTCGTAASTVAVTFEMGTIEVVKL